MWLYSVKSGCIWVKWLYSGKIVVFGQNCCIRTKVVVFGLKWLYLGKNGCIWAKWLYSGKSGCIQLSTAFIYFSQGSPISPLRTVINRSPVHPKNYKIQNNLKILKRKFTHYNIAKTSIKEVKISSWPRRKPN